MEANIFYSPQQIGRERLEQLFVNREPQLDLVLNRIATAADSGSLAHMLFVGARGSGKTYLVLMAYHKAIQSDGFGERYSVSLLPEEPYGITSFETLIDAIDDYREPRQTDSIKDIVTVAFIENFDRILDTLGPEGQKSLRAHLERNRNMLLITTAQRLSGDSFEQAAPFYGFFDTVNLSAFTNEEITRMLVRKAEVNGEAELAKRLKENDIQARLAALAQVTGGLPRIWSIFSFGLVLENLPDMVNSMLEKLDQLTPLYQEMLWRLSPNERKAVLALIDADSAMTVKTLAEETNIDQRSLGKTLRSLTPGWVIPREGYLMQFIDKRNTYYQLAEPLARIVTQIKSARGRPVKAVVDFIAAWFTLDELDKSPLVKSAIPNPEYAQNCESDEQYYGFSTSYIAESVEILISSNYRLREQMLIGVTNISYDIRHPARIDEELVNRCISVDDAFSDLQESHSAERILALPSGIANMIESQLNAKSCALLRVELALLAVRSGGSDEWLIRAISAISSKNSEFSLRPDEEKTAQLIVSCIRILLGQIEAGLQTLDAALSTGERELTDTQWGILAKTVEKALSG